MKCVYVISSSLGRFISLFHSQYEFFGNTLKDLELYVQFYSSSDTYVEGGSVDCAICNMTAVRGLRCITNIPRESKTQWVQRSCPRLFLLTSITVDVKYQ